MRCYAYFEHIGFVIEILRSQFRDVVNELPSPLDNATADTRTMLLRVGRASLDIVRQLWELPKGRLTGGPHVQQFAFAAAVH